MTSCVAFVHMCVMHVHMHACMYMHVYMCVHTCICMRVHARWPPPSRRHFTDMNWNVHDLCCCCPCGMPCPHPHPRAHAHAPNATPDACAAPSIMQNEEQTNKCGVAVGACVIARAIIEELVAARAHAGLCSVDKRSQVGTSITASRRAARIGRGLQSTGKKSRTPSHNRSRASP